jgi:hypothetical protein
MHQKKRFPNLLSLSNRPQIALERSASRLQRAFTTQIDKLGNKGWRQEVMVEHVHVHPGRAAGEVPLVHQPGDLAPALMRRALGTKAARDNSEDCSLGSGLTTGEAGGEFVTSRAWNSTSYPF